MGILRADVVSHSQLEPTGGSIYLDGTGDYLSIASANAFAFGTGAFTFECWVNRPSLSAAAQICGSSNDNFNLYMNTNGTISLWNGSANITTTNTIDDDTWTHVAICRVGTGNGQMRVFIDGVQGVNGTNATTYAAGNLLIGRNSNSGSTYGKGYISNVRVTGTAVYKQNFTVPKFELENIPGTILLCCRSSSSATASDVTYAAITSNGDTTASAVAPDVKKDIIDTGVVIGDNTKFDTLSYMVPPGGTTTESNRGRAVMAGGMANPTVNTNTIEYLEIQSGGMTKDFGDLTIAKTVAGPISSSTRGVIVGGIEPSPARTNRIDYITIATTSNATDFGDYVEALGYVGGVSNNTRGVTAGGNGPSSPNGTNQIGYLTIATTGNAADFGDLTAATTGIAGAGSPTRGIFFAGQINPGSWTVTNKIEYITIATTGNAADFGDVTLGRQDGGACSSSIRAVFAGGYNATPAAQTELNTIDYVTIASTGNATDFGDLTVVGAYLGGTSNSTRGIFGGRMDAGPAGGDTTIDSIIIASTGNAVNWGDMTGSTVRRAAATVSDSHGGIS